MKIETVCEGCVFEANCDGRFMKDAECWRRIKPLDIPNIKHDDPYETYKQTKDCACLDIDARRCFEIRYQGTTPENEMAMSTEVCDCPCHEKAMDYDGDDCDCYECNDGKIV